MTDLQVEGLPDANVIRVDLVQIDRDIRAGLPAERERLRCAELNQKYLDGDGDLYIPRRPAEAAIDYDQRPKLCSYMTRKVIHGLTCYTYAPGPQRTLGDEAASAWYERVAVDNGLNALWHDADRLATLQGVSAFQVAATGDPRRPLRVHVWSAEELVVWCPSDDALNPQAVCTITGDGEDKVYTLWTAAFVREYRTNRSALGSDRTLIEPVGDDQPNPYGILPFSFIHHERPTRRFWTKGIGTLVRKINARVDEKLSELAEAQRFYLKPVPLATGVPPGWRPKIQPGLLTVVPFKPGGNGDPTMEPKVWFLQAEVNVEAAWADITNTIETGLSDLGIPLAAYRSDQSAVKSGAAMVVEQKPLLDHARSRRLHYGEAEKGLAKLVCRIGGTYYEWSDAGLKAALLAEADDPQLTLAWPDDLDIPTIEETQVTAQDMDLGLTSPVAEIMRRRGFTRDQAERLLAENVADMALYHQLQAQAGLPPAAQTAPDAEIGDGLPDPDAGEPDPEDDAREGDEMIPDPATTPGYL